MNSRDVEKRGIDRQMLVIRDKADIIKAVDELGDDGIALVLINKRDNSGEALQVLTYGEGRETEFAGLFMYGSVMLHRQYFGGEE
jgi:hypothetical protein